jgi:hypothetical protein
MGQDGEEGDAAEEGGAEPSAGARQRAGSAGDGGLGHHGVTVAAEQAFAEGVEATELASITGDQGVGEGVAADILQAVENLHRGDRA